MLSFLFSAIYLICGSLIMEPAVLDQEHFVSGQEFSNSYQDSSVSGLELSFSGFSAAQLRDTLALSQTQSQEPDNKAVNEADASEFKDLEDALNVENEEMLITKQTFLFANKSSQELYLDLYNPKSEEPSPCVIFVFGGGFFSGERDSPSYNAYFNYLNSIGYSVVSIDYRLGLRRATNKTSAYKFFNLLMDSVEIAVEDLYDATLYVLEHSAEWNIDPSKIIISGSSAGAITVLQAEYELCRRSELTKSMPSDFNYAGVISFAGALVRLGGQKPKWVGEPCPIMLFHGNADNFVTYDKTGFLTAKMYGSSYIVNLLDRIDAPYYFYIGDNIDHAMAVLPMNEQRERIKFFLDEFVMEGKRLQISNKSRDLLKPVKKKNLGISDYVGTISRFM